MKKIPAGMYFLHGVALLIAGAGAALAIRGEPIVMENGIGIWLLWVPLVSMIAGDLYLLWESRQQRKRY